MVELDVCGFWFILATFSWKPLEPFPRECHTVAPCSRTGNPDCFTKSLQLWTAQIWPGLFLALNTQMKFWSRKCVKLYHLSYLHLLDMVCYSTNVGYIIEFLNSKPTLHSWSFGLDVSSFVKLLDLLILCSGYMGLCSWHPCHILSNYAGPTLVQVVVT